MNTPYSINTFVQAYNAEILLIVKKLPDLVTNIGSFTFMQESSADDPNASADSTIAPFENAVKDQLKAILDKIAQMNAYSATLQYSSIVIDSNNLGHPYNTTFFPILDGILSYCTLLKNDLANILTQIETFNTSTFDAFAIINSEPYKQIAALLPSNYSVNFITTTQNFLASNKTIDVYTKDLYEDSVPAGLISAFVNGSAARVQSINNYTFPNQVALDAAATAYIPPSSEP